MFAFVARLRWFRAYTINCSSYQSTNYS